MKTYSLPVDPGALNYRVIPPIYRGDGVAIEVSVYDAANDPITDLTFYDVLVAISHVPFGHPSNRPDIVRKHLVSGDGTIVRDGVVRFDFPDADLTSLKDGRSYYINAVSRGLDEVPLPQGTAILTIYQALDIADLPPILPAIEAGEALMTFEDGAFVAFSDGALLTQMEPA